MINILIVDDEPAAAHMLEVLIHRHMAVPHECHVCLSAEEALKKIPAIQPTLLMLDVEMPGMNGFDLLNRAAKWEFDVVFTTAHNQYAIQAIRFSALDYLLKPIDIPELQNALYRHIMRLEMKKTHSGALISNLMDNLQQKDSSGFKLAVNTMEGCHFFLPKEIVRCEGDDSYTRFYLASGKELLVSRTLKEFEELLSGHHFMRVHKSHLVNKNYVSRFDREGMLWLTNGVSVPVSRRRKNIVLKGF